jgi:hypothetical protein
MYFFFNEMNIQKYFNNNPLVNRNLMISISLFFIARRTNDYFFYYSLFFDFFLIFKIKKLESENK